MIGDVQMSEWIRLNGVKVRLLDAENGCFFPFPSWHESQMIILLESELECKTGSLKDLTTLETTLLEGRSNWKCQMWEEVFIPNKTTAAHLVLSELPLNRIG